MQGKGMKMKILSFVTIILVYLLMITPAFSDVPLEDPIFAEGAKAIRDMHGLNMLGLTGDLITIFVAANEASKAAEILYQNKWRPGDDDLGWVDEQRSERKSDPLAGLSRDDRMKWKDKWEKIKYLQSLVTPYSTVSEKEEISKAIKIQFSHLNRIIAGYRDIVEQVGFVSAHTNEKAMPASDPVFDEGGVEGVWDTTHTHAGFTGDWDTNWGMMTIKEDGSGSYTHDKGKIKGSVKGKTFKGTWSEAPSYNAPKDAGDVELTLSADGKTFTGKWRKGSAGDWKHDWNGKRVYKGGENR